MHSPSHSSKNSDISTRSDGTIGTREAGKDNTLAPTTSKADFLNIVGKLNAKANYAMVKIMREKAFQFSLELARSPTLENFRTWETKVKTYLELLEIMQNATKEPVERSGFSALIQEQRAPSVFWAYWDDAQNNEGQSDDPERTTQLEELWKSIEETYGYEDVSGERFKCALNSVGNLDRWGFGVKRLYEIRPRVAKVAQKEKNMENESDEEEE